VRQSAEALRDLSDSDTAASALVEPARNLTPEFSEFVETLADGGAVDRLFGAGLAIARQADAAGASHVAFTILRSLRAAFPGAATQLHARAIALQADIAQRLGFRMEASRLSLEAEIVAQL